MGLSSFLLQVWGGKGHQQGIMAEDEISSSGGRGVPPVQTALIFPNEKLLSSLSCSIPFSL